MKTKLVYWCRCKQRATSWPARQGRPEDPSVHCRFRWQKMTGQGRLTTAAVVMALRKAGRPDPRHGADQACSSPALTLHLLSHGNKTNQTSSTCDAHCSPRTIRSRLPAWRIQRTTPTSRRTFVSDIAHLSTHCWRFCRLLLIDS
jgi:hypothetical protein